MPDTLFLFAFLIIPAWYTPYLLLLFGSGPLQRVYPPQPLKKGVAGLSHSLPSEVGSTLWFVSSHQSPIGPFSFKPIARAVQSEDTLDRLSCSC